MSVYRYKGKWKAEAWIGSQRIGSRSGFPTKADAAAWEKLRVSEFRVPDKLKPVTQQVGPTFDDLLERYERIHLPTVSSESRRRYELDIKLRIRSYFQYRPLASITPWMVEAFRSEIMAKLSKKSVNNCSNLLFSIFRKGEEWGMLDRSPVRIRPLRVAQEKYTWWDEREHIEKFLGRVETSRYFAAYLLALETGMRLGEIVGLSKKDVDFGRCQIHVHRQWIDKDNAYGPTKGRRERFINFSPKSRLKGVLREAILRSPHPEAIFVSSEGVRVRPRRLAGFYFQKSIRSAKVPRIRFHDLRHTFASWYMITVGDIWALKAILGHVDVQTTQRYAHLSKKVYEVPTMCLFKNENYPQGEIGA